jgi:hypothetical protein
MHNLKRKLGSHENLRKIEQMLVYEIANAEMAKYDFF